MYFSMTLPANSQQLLGQMDGLEYILIVERPKQWLVLSSPICQEIHTTSRGESVEAYALTRAGTAASARTLDHHILSESSIKD
jgi:hypothetical protein